MEVTKLYLSLQSEKLENNVDQLTLLKSLLTEVNNYKPNFVLLDQGFNELNFIDQLVDEIERNLPLSIRGTGDSIRRISDVLMQDPEEILVIQGPTEEGRGLIRLAMEVFVKKVTFHLKQAKSLKVIICTHLDTNERIFQPLLSLLQNEHEVHFVPNFQEGFLCLSKDCKNIWMIMGSLTEYPEDKWTKYKNQCLDFFSDPGDWVFCLNNDLGINDKEDSWNEKLGRMFNALVYRIAPCFYDR